MASLLVSTIFAQLQYHLSCGDKISAGEASDAIHLTSAMTTYTVGKIGKTMMPTLTTPTKKFHLSRSFPLQQPAS
jgi:hypothetical protein